MSAFAVTFCPPRIRTVAVAAPDRSAFAVLLMPHCFFAYASGAVRASTAAFQAQRVRVGTPRAAAFFARAWAGWHRFAGVGAEARAARWTPAAAPVGADVRFWAGSVLTAVVLDPLRLRLR